MTWIHIINKDFWEESRSYPSTKWNPPRARVLITINKTTAWNAPFPLSSEKWSQSENDLYHGRNETSYLVNKPDKIQKPLSSLVYSVDFSLLKLSKERVPLSSQYFSFLNGWVLNQFGKFKRLNNLLLACNFSIPSFLT